MARRRACKAAGKGGDGASGHAFERRGLRHESTPHALHDSADDDPFPRSIQLPTEMRRRTLLFLIGVLTRGTLRLRLAWPHAQIKGDKMRLWARALAA